MNQLFKYYSPLNKTSQLQSDNSNQIKNYRSNYFQSSDMSVFKTINKEEMKCQNYNLNGNYKKIYFYKDDDEENQLNSINDCFDLNNFIFKELDEEKTYNNKENELRNNNKKNINNISNAIKKNIRLIKNKKNSTNKNRSNIKENKSNKSNTKKKARKNNKETKENSMTINKKIENENSNIILNDSNVFFKVINLSTINNNSLVIISKKNDLPSNDLNSSKKNENNTIIKNHNNNNNLRIKYIQQSNEKDTNQNVLKNGRNKGKFNKSQSADKLNFILEDYYKNKNNNESKIENKNNLSVSLNLGKDNIKVTYSSSCDNKKTIRKSSRGARVTIFQHFNRTQKIIENKN
jgi:hypothetical protein